MISLAYKLFHGGVGQVHGRLVCDELVQAHGRLVSDKLAQVHGDDDNLTLAHRCVIHGRLSLVYEFLFMAHDK